MKNKGNKFTGSTLKWDSFSVKGFCEDEEISSISSFYFSEFPKTCRAKEFFDLLKEHGCLKEVVIPPKRNALGKVFGFARFSDVEDQCILATRMDCIFIGKNKIHANLPKFQRKKVASRVGSGESLFGGSDMRGFRGVTPISNMLYGRWVGVRSFADVLGDCNGVNPPKPFLSFVPRVEV